MSQNQTDYFDSIIGKNNAETSQKTTKDYFDTILSAPSQTKKDADMTSIGTELADKFNTWVDETSKPILDRGHGVDPVSTYKVYQQARENMLARKKREGFNDAQLAEIAKVFDEKADPRHKTSDGKYYLGDRVNDVAVGVANLAADALAAVPESIPFIGEWADKAEQSTREVGEAWKNDISDRAKIQRYIGEKTYQDALANGDNEFVATMKSVWADPMQVASLFAEQAPQFLLGAAGKGVLGATNLLGGAGRLRNDIEQAYDDTLKTNPKQLLTLPEIQQRMAEGMSFEQAVNDAKTDVSDNWARILMGALIGGTEALSPLGKIGQGLNRGVLGTLGKEVAQEAFQEGAEQLNSNAAVGRIDGKTQLTDGVVRNATLGGIVGLGMGIPSAIDAHLNDRKVKADEKSKEDFQKTVQQHSTTSQPNQQNSTHTINAKVMDNVLNKANLSEEDRQAYEQDLKNDLRDGTLQRHAEQDPGVYGEIAREYLAQTGQQVQNQPQPQQTYQEASNTQQPNAQYQTSLTAEQIPLYQQFTKEMSEAANSANPNQAIAQVQQKYGENVPLFMAEISRQLAFFHPEAVKAMQEGEPQKANDLLTKENQEGLNQSAVEPQAEQVNAETASEQNSDPETQEQQALYSRSPMKSVEANIHRGRERMTQAILTKSDVKRGMYNQEFGWVDFVWGDDGTTKPLGRNGEPAGRGISHIFEARQRKDGMTEQQVSDMLVHNIVETIAKGEVKTRTPSRLALEYKSPNEPNGHKVLLTKNKGSNAWVLSGYEIDPNKGRKGEKMQAGRDTSTPTSTHTDPTHPRADMGASLVASGSEQIANVSGLNEQGSNTALELGRPANPSHLNDTHAHSQRGRGVVAENGKNIINSATQVNQQVAEDTEIQQAREVSDPETQEQQALYSRSPMKSVEANIHRGRERMTQAILTKSDVKRGMYNQEFGWVDFVWGDDGLTKPFNKKGEPVGKGIAHIIEARQRKNGMSEADITNMLVNEIVETIAKGTVINPNPKNKLELDYRSQRDGKVYRATLTRNKGNNAWVLTAFDNSSKYMGEGASRLGNDSSTSTDISPTLTRADIGASPLASGSEQIANVSGLNEQGSNTALELGRPANPSHLNDTHAHSQRGRGVVAENGKNIINSATQVNQQVAEDTEIQQAREVLRNALGEHADKVEIVRTKDLDPNDPNYTKKSTSEGWYQNGKQYINLDIIKDGDVLNKNERLVWVAWHELAHHGVRMRYQGIFNNILATARKNPVVSNIARLIAEERASENIAISKEEALEEALVEIFSAQQTGNWAELESRYHTKIHHSWKNGGKLDMKKDLSFIAKLFKRLISMVTGKKIDDVSDKALFDILAGIKQGIAENSENQTAYHTEQQANEPRYSLNENADSDFAKAVDTVSQGGNIQGYVNVGTTPNVLKMLGLPDVNVTIHGSTFKKVMQDKHNVTPETLKQLPSQINDPVAVMKSVTQDNSYIVLTELVEQDNDWDKPVIAALHLKQDKNGLELINIASVYGRSKSQVQKGLNEDLLYWNKKKGTEFVNTFGLQLPAYVSQEQSIGSNVKTETDLSQYQNQSSDNVKNERSHDLSEIDNSSTGLASENNGEFSTDNDDIRFSRPKSESLEKLRNAETIRISGKDIEPSTDLREYKRNALNYGKTLRGTYTNKDTGREINLGRNGIQEVLRHDYKDPDHLQSIAAIPQIIENAVYIDTLPNEETTKNPDIQEYEYYLAGLNIGGDDYVVRAVVGTSRKNGERYYDHKLTPINKNELLSLSYRVSTAGLSENNSLSEIDDKRLLQILQDENATNGEGDIRFSRPKSESLEKLRNAETIRISGKDIEPSDDIRQYRRNAFDFGKTLRGVYTNKDTGREISLGRSGVTEVLHHDVSNPEHLQSIAAIPQIIENAIYIDTLPNEETTKNPDIKEYEYYVVGLNIGGTDYTVKAAVGIATTGDKYYDHKLTKIEKGDLLEMTSRLSSAEISNSSPLSEIDDKRLLQILQDENATNGEGEDDIRFSRPQSVLEQIKSGKRADNSEGIWQDIIHGEFKQAMKRFQSKVAEGLRDETRPLRDWVDSLPVSRVLQKELSSASDRADLIRMAKNSEVIEKFFRPLMRNLGTLRRQSKKKGKEMPTLEMTKYMAEYWYSARWSIIKSKEMLEKERVAMEDARKAWEDAKVNGTKEEIARAYRAFARAETQYNGRKSDVETTVFGRDAEGKPLYQVKVGQIGGWSIPHAQAIMAEVETYFDPAQIEIAMKPLRDAVRWNLEQNKNANRITPELYREFVKQPEYVPLTGDPRADVDSLDDLISGASGRGVNTQRDKGIKGRKNSEAEGAIDAVNAMLDKTNANTAWQPFKDKLDEIYQELVEQQKANGLTQSDAERAVRDEFGLSRAILKGLTRTSDNVIIRKFGNISYEYRLPDKVTRAVKGAQKNETDYWFASVLKPVTALTGYYARGVTQYRPTFAITNMIRDVAERATVLPTREILDNQGNPLSQKEKDKIAKKMWRRLFNPMELGRMMKATSKLAWKGKEALDDNDPHQKALKQLIDLGGASTFRENLYRTERSLLKALQQENMKIDLGVRMANRLVAAWNGMFDYISSITAFMSLTEAGITPEQAAEITLNLTNFNKVGKWTKHVRGLYAFLNPTLQGAGNLADVLSTKKGWTTLVKTVIVLGALQAGLMYFDDDDDELGNRYLRNDLTRNLLIPMGEKDSYFKVPIGYGLPQLAATISSNGLKAMYNQITPVDAAANILTGFAKNFTPVAPSEIPASKYLTEKVADTFTPTLLKPVMQQLFNRNAFGSQITYSNDQAKVLRADQGKSTTSDFWKDLAVDMHETMGWDIEPELYQHYFNSYKGFFGIIGEWISDAIENPNRALHGKEEINGLERSISAFHGKIGQNSPSNFFYEAKGEAELLAKERESYKERETEKNHPLTEKEQKLLRWNTNVENALKHWNNQKRKLNQQHKEKKISDVAFTARIKVINTNIERIHRNAVAEYRKIEGLRTR